MNVFVTASAPIKPVSKAAFVVSQIAAAAVTVVAVAQLYTFEDYASVLAYYPLPGGSLNAPLVAALIVTVEVLAVPSLFMMKLSPLMRLFSFVCGLAATVVWKVLGLYLVTQHMSTMNNGLFGATLATPNGWLPLLFALILAAGLVSVAPTLKFSLKRS